ncbi:hypothetical protein F5Y14DRAFT_103927 [Nemania sp. NC0429]|nr:hypothetical protein F5Y14DRAFT_103927 [Nemania sp. NC0429]
MHFANTSTSAFLYCPPVAQTLYTTVYETVLPAACETSQWMATYTVTQTCTGKKSDFVTPTMPPGFVVTTVSCAVCAESEIEITCPGAYPTGMGKQTVEIGGNGITATITASPTPAKSRMYPVATPTKTVTVSVHGGGSGSGSGSQGGMVNNGTTSYGTTSYPPPPPVAVSGAAVSWKRSLVLGAGLTFVAGHFFLL